MSANKRNEYKELFARNPIKEGESERAYFRRLSEDTSINRQGYSWQTFKKQYVYLKDNGFSEEPIGNEKGAPSDKDSSTWDEKGTNAFCEINTASKVIDTLDKALKHSGVDLGTWEVDRHVFNSWGVTMKGSDGNPVHRTNYQVKIWFVKRIDHGIDWEETLKGVSKAIRSHKIKKVKGSGVGVVGAADFHFGAYIDDLLRSDRFNITILADYLKTAAEIINAKGYSEVHVMLLGDFIESFTGLNHNNSWKGLGKGMFGMNSVILCYEILMEAFLSKINNLKGVYIVSGNHDRVTSGKEGDEKGEVAQLLAYMFQKDLKEQCEVVYHPMLIGREIDGVFYVMTHGHLPIAQKEISKVLFDYGKQGMYNVFVQGHKHSRIVTKSTRKKHYEWGDVKVVQLDEVDYRAITLPPLFTGNFYSESLGFSSSAGFSILESNRKGRINYFDYCL